VSLVAWALVGVLASAWPFSAPVPDEAVVARATGPSGPIELTAARLRRYCEAHPDRNPRDAADDLLVVEVMAQEAERRRLGEAPEVHQAIAEAAVPLYLKRSFEAEHTAATIPMAFLQKVYERNIGYYKRPELRAADHILVAAPGFVRPAAGAQESAARALVERIARELGERPPRDAADFRGRVDLWRNDAKSAELEIKTETLQLFAREGVFDSTFSAAAFAIPAVGEVSPLVDTRYGFHLIRLDRVEAPREVSFEAARAEISERMLSEYRAMEFRRRSDALLQAAGLAVDLTLLGLGEPTP
jgi:peptidyl-prolyl cis-trans isomerase C